MSMTTEEATDAMLARVKAAVDAYDATIVIQWPGRKTEDYRPPADDVRWMRVSVQHNSGGQASLSGALGKKRWRREGEIFVQCFNPLSKGGSPVAVEMACVIRDAFEATGTGGVWYREAKINDVGTDRAWYHVNASSHFQYDTVR
jgi:hypothetical protein